MKVYGTVVDLFRDLLLNDISAVLLSELLLLSNISIQIELIIHFEVLGEVGKAVVDFLTGAIP